MWLQEIDKAITELEKHLPRNAKTALDVGSEGEEYRNIRQPWNKKFYDYLAGRGIKVFTMDLDPEAKPDFIQDITVPILGDDIYDLVIATHLLEHVPTESFQTVVSNLEKLVADSGHLLVSVPHKYPYHERPIDTMYRPTREELRKVFNGTLLYGETFEVDHTMAQYMNEPKCQVTSILLRY
jgi:SAM-dependent methyltransferase